MRALLDTNIIIHRENTKVTSYSIGKLFYWLDKLHYEKLIHPHTVSELRKYHNPQMQDLYDAKLDAYAQMKSIAPQSDQFKQLLADTPKTPNDEIDNQLLCEVYCGRADILITEDRRMVAKAARIGISERVFSIDSFITKASRDNPELIEYKALSVRQEYFGNVDVKDTFFDTFRAAYPEFETWFAGKCDERAYICRSDKNDILGFLYLKTEDESEDYSDITPAFSQKRRLKVGTFKVESTGFRLGERFIKIIFDNAIERNLDEIYVTQFVDKPELQALYDLLIRWGFFEHGVKRSNGKEEVVLVKCLGRYIEGENVISNFPTLKPDSKKTIMPILPQYHTALFPDSILNNEVEYIANVPHRYALQKVYISWAPERDINPGDLVLFYRMGTTYPKKYSSVLTTVGVVDQIISAFSCEDDFLKQCQNRSVFSLNELKGFWQSHRNNLKVLKFVYVKSLSKKLTLEYLWNHDIISPPDGPRPFTRLTNDQFEMILRDSGTELYI